MRPSTITSCKQTKRQKNLKKLIKRSQALSTVKQPIVNTISVNKLERFVFPNQDIEPVNVYQDNRTELEIFQDILKILARNVKACDLALYEKLLQRSPLTKEMSENGIIKSAAELKAEIKKFKMNNKTSKLLDNITDNLRSHVKNMQLHMVYLHNNVVVKGKPRYEIKLNNLKLSTSDEQYINNRFQF